jgi:hypothetical protein
MLSPKSWNSNKNETKILSGLFISKWKSFLKLFSKLNLKHNISLLNRKSSCGYATHFFSVDKEIVFFYLSYNVWLLIKDFMKVLKILVEIRHIVFLDHIIKYYYWPVVICLVIVYTGFGGSLSININKKPWWVAISKLYFDSSFESSSGRIIHFYSNINIYYKHLKK